MPVRSLNSSVLKWPNHRDVDRAVRAWTEHIIKTIPGIMRLGYFGSYARGDWGVGSDLDLVAIVEHSDEPFEKRSLNWDVNKFPVPAQVLVYTWKEWESLRQEGGRFARTLERETVWIYQEDSREGS